MTQEYGRYFGMKTGIFRGGCLTGPYHSAVELHGFLVLPHHVHRSEHRHYTIFGYKGKQVRDQIHSRDVIAAFDRFITAPRTAAVYNLGGGRQNSVSVLEAIGMVEQRVGSQLDWEYVDESREGDHICYISDLSRLEADYPGWTVTASLDDIVNETVEAQLAVLAMTSAD